MYDIVKVDYLFMPVFSLYLMVASLFAQDQLVDPPPYARSPEGATRLQDLQKQMVQAFGDARIEKRFLAAHKLAQLHNDELNGELLHAVIESLNTPNLNYRWYVSHLLYRVSGESHGVNLTGWRTWLAQRDQTLEVSALPDLKSGSQGHDNSGGVAAENVPPSTQLGHDPNERVMDPQDQEEKNQHNREGVGRMMGPGVGEDLPKPPAVNSKSDLRDTVTKTNVRENYEREIPAVSQEPEGPGEMFVPERNN